MLLSAGQAEALKYPIGLLQDEAAIVLERENMGSVTNAFVIRAAFAAVMVEDGHEIFNEMIEVLEDGR